MHRWILKLPFGRQIRVHNILKDDEDRELHDHPFDFVSVMLKGSYREMTPHLDDIMRDMSTKGAWIQFPTRYTAPCFLYRKAEDLHRLTEVKDTWTLVFAGPRRRMWGFSKGPGDWTPYREFVSVKKSLL
jgi:hypothetical protein